MQRIFSCALVALIGAITAFPVSSQGPPPVLVQTAPVAEMEFHDQLTLVGRTQARAESRIVAETSGRVASVDAAEGRRIARGAALLKLDCRRTELALEAKRAESGQARAVADLAKKELARAEDLVKTEIFPERNLDNAVSEAARAEEWARQLGAEIRRLELDLENCVVRAPYAGYTLRRLVDAGEWVEVGTPVWEMVDLSRIRTTVDLPERRFGDLRIGSQAQIKTDDGAVLSGEVTGIARQASETTHTFPVIVTVDNPEGELAGGMLVRVTLDLDETFRGPAISKDAIVRRDDRTSVYAVVDGVARQLPVRIRAQSGDMVALEGDGVEIGDELVIRGNERLAPGSPVRTGSESE